MTTSVRAERDQLRQLRRLRQRAREALRARVRKVRAAAKRYRVGARRRIRAWYWAEREKLRAERRRRLAAIRDNVAKRLATLKESAALARAEKRLSDQVQILAALREVRGGAKAERNAIRREHRERTTEAKRVAREEVEREIEHHDPALLPVWQKVRQAIKPRPRMSLAEAFFQWVHDNPEETLAIQAAHGDRGASKLIEDLAGQEAAFRKAEHERAVERLHVTIRAGVLTVRRGGKRLARFRVREGLQLGAPFAPRPSAEVLELASEAARRHLAKLRKELAEVPF